MAYRPPSREVRSGSPDWMCTFADLMCLLLGFFILMLSFSNTESEKFTTVAGSIRDAFGVRSPIDIMPVPSGSRVVPVPAPGDRVDSHQVPLSTKRKLARVREVLEKSELTGQGEVEVTGRGVVLRLSGDAVFGSGRTDLAPAAEDLLGRLVELASTSAGDIEVEGHTDDVPIASTQYPSNWELSTARAGSAVRYLASRGLPTSRLKAIGYADTRPLVPNDSAENRSKNRRIEVLFIEPGSRDGRAGSVPAARQSEPAASSPEEVEP